jgi:hypothetical protein
VEPLTFEQVHFWISKDPAAEIAEAIGTLDQDEKTRLIKNIDRVKTISEYAAIPFGSRCLDHLALQRSQQRSHLFRQAANDLKSDRDEIFFLTGITDFDDSAGYYILLDQIGAIRTDQVTDSIERLRRGERSAYRFGTLVKTYKYAVAQRFSFLFQKIGLPAEHKLRHETALTRFHATQ